MWRIASEQAQVAGDRRLEREQRLDRSPRSPRKSWSISSSKAITSSASSTSPLLRAPGSRRGPPRAPAGPPPGAALRSGRGLRRLPSDDTVHLMGDAVSSVRHHSVTRLATAPYPTRLRAGRTLAANPRGGGTSMPKLGTSIRIISARRGHRAPCGRRRRARPDAKPARQAAHDLSGAGSTFVPPLVDQWVTPIGAAFGYELPSGGIGSGGGVKEISGAPSTSAQVTRRCPRTSSGLQRTRADPVGARCHRRPLQPARRREPPPHGRRDAGGDLPRQDHALERPGDREAQPRRHSCRERRSPPPTAPTARARPPSSPTSCQVRPAWKPAGRASRQWPVGLGGKGNSGVAGMVKRRRARSATPTSPTPAEPARLLRGEEQLRQVRHTGLARHRRGRHEREKPAPDNSLSIVNPPAKKATPTRTRVPPTSSSRARRARLMS